MRLKSLTGYSSWLGFNAHRKKVAKQIRHSYRAYINEVFGTSLSENFKRFWSYINVSNTENICIHTPNNAYGPNELPPTIHRDHAYELAPMLSFIFK